ncbi:MAG TPA: hypothetical protein PKA28_09850 [Methylomusa anaerophila]|uniref:Uncharacterized protein n=1 Tax=Methylomusa anaerophila TaxID=1930071 RepID=A0A348AHV2_9FIRM|nr:hypothetical protein [Methylomusa anaerophila]BBB90650.1 hypothetical protein MAMMFC1_01311 [Methylomusa anaerophila]HML88742.1 hypothetical protein [Methylomusa anaerophila]
MTERTKAELYLTYLDRILAGEKDIEPVEDGEIAELIRLAQTMIAADFSSKSKIREILRKQLLGRLSPEDKAILAVMANDGRKEGELLEEELNFVTAAGQGVGNICPRCGANMGWVQRKCPFCR